MARKPKGPEISESAAGGVESRDQGTSGAAGAQHTPTYIHSTAEYIAVRRSDLRDIAKFGWLEEGVGAWGMFFIAGPVWMAAALFFDHLDHWQNYWAGYLFCLVCIIFGSVLIWIAHSHFQLREKRISVYFRDSLVS